MITNEQIVQREWDQKILDERYPKWEGVGCYYCGSGEDKDCPACKGKYQEEINGQD